LTTIIAFARIKSKSANLSLKETFMRTLYNELNIRIPVETSEILILNIVFERFSRHIPRHSHGEYCYEIHYVPSGYGTVIVNGESYKISPNTLYVTGPHVEHEQIPDRVNPMAEYCIYLQIIKKSTAASGSLLHLLTATPFWFGRDTQHIHAVMRMIFTELKNHYVGYMTQVEALLQQSLVCLIRNYNTTQKSSSHFGPSTLTDRKYIITEEYFLYEYQTLALPDLAGKLGLSIRQTNRFLKKCYGKNFLQKSAEAKMSAASSLLLNTTLSATDIAFELGYSSLEHFLTAFKRYYGVGTREFRRNREQS